MLSGIQKQLTDCESLTITTHVSKELLKVVQSEYKDLVNSNTPICHTFDECNQILNDSKAIQSRILLTLPKLKPEYIMAYLAISGILLHINISEFYACHKHYLKSCLPVVDWEVSKNSQCIGRSDPLVYFGGTLNYQLPFNLKPGKAPYVASSPILEQDSQRGNIFCRCRQVASNTPLAEFYSISDRLLYSPLSSGDFTISSESRRIDNITLLCPSFIASTNVGQLHAFAILGEECTKP